MLSLRDLEFLTSLARRRHFARAAEDCGVSQPAFSMRIRKIEETLAVSLVTRGNRFQGFTPEGKAVIRHAHAILDSMRVMEQELRSARGDVSGTLSIGVIPTAMVHAARITKALQSDNPAIRVTLHTTTSIAIQQGLLEGLFDAGITYGDGVSSDIFRIHELYQESYFLLASERLLPQTKGSLTWAEVAELPLCLLEPEMQNRKILDNLFADLGLVPKVITQSSGFIAAMVLAAEELTATIIPQHIVDMLGKPKGTVALNLVNPVLQKQVCLISAARDLNLPTVDALYRSCDSVS